MKARIFMILVAVTGLWSFASGAPSFTAPDTAELNEEQVQLNVESFDIVWTTILERHWEPEISGLDWNAVRDELRPQVLQATTMDSARAPIEEMIDRLDGQVLVTAVADDSPAEQAGVRRGWIIESIDGEALAPALSKVAEQFGDTLYAAMALAGTAKRRLAGPVGAEHELALRDGSGKTVDVSLKLAEQRGNKLEVGFLPPMHVWIDYERIEGSIGYIAFNMFIDPARVMRVFNEAMESFMDADGVIIDLRGNPGGMAMMAMGMAGWLIEEKNLHLGTMITRDNELKIVVFPRPKVYGGPVAVLVDGLSGSCSEIFSGGLQDLGRARIFGSRTAGAVLPSAIEKLPNGDGFQYAFANYVSAGGAVLEGVGVIPDSVAEPNREALLNERDTALDAAVAWVRSQN